MDRAREVQAVTSALSLNALVAEPRKFSIPRDDRWYALEGVASAFLDAYGDHSLDNGRRAVVSDGYLPERTVKTGISNFRRKIKSL